MWFHISRTDLGPAFLFTPRVPCEIMAKEDKTIKRICVSSNIIGCLFGMYGVKDLEELVGERDIEENLFLYEFDVKSIYKPTKKQVPDVKITDEHWILSPTIGIRKSKICSDSLKLGIISIIGAV